MKVSYYIAKRYLFAKKSRLVNWIAGISTVSIAVGTAALILVLSVFNGLNTLIEGMYNSFDPDIKIQAAEGKYFTLPAATYDVLSKSEGVDLLVRTLEENVLLRYADQERIISLKGVDTAFDRLTTLQEKVWEGEYFLREESTASYEEEVDAWISSRPYAVVGAGIYQGMGISVKNPATPLEFYSPKRGTQGIRLSEEAFQVVYAWPAASFSTILEYDEKYVLVDLSLMQLLLDTEEEISALEVKVKPGFSADKVQSRLQKILGDDFTVKSRAQQQELYYKTIHSERLSILLIFAFILLIATFNLMGSLSMMIYEKRRDILVLRCLGAETPTLKSIFLLEGFFIALVGGLGGLCLGGFLAWLQQRFGLIQLGQDGEGFIVDAYPVEIRSLDFALVIAIVLAIGFLASFLPVWQWGRKRGWK